MATFPRMRQVQLFMGATLLLCAQAASAQYVWLNEKGVRQYSDRAPPASVPLKNIIKGPGAMAGANSSVAAEPVAAKTRAASDKPAAPLTVAEREAANRKQKAEQADKDAQAAAVAANQQERKAACDLATAARAQLDSGVRMRGKDQVWYDDKMRAQHSAEVNSILYECANPTEKTAKK